MSAVRLVGIVEAVVGLGQTFFVWQDMHCCRCSMVRLLPISVSGTSWSLGNGKVSKQSDGVYRRSVSRESIQYCQPMHHESCD